MNTVTTTIITLVLGCALPACSAQPDTHTGETMHHNRLAQSRSPYLLQHADNPVDWYPWGEEAFKAATEQDKPIFLSIGYATCHWCHVMAHESFEDPEVAALMNSAFINIKVDREERPDIDQVYMSVTQMLTGSGGWPMTIIMTPNKRPFFAGTYIPKNIRFGRMGMMELIPKVLEAWTHDRQKLLESAGQIVANLQSVADRSRPGELGSDIIKTTRRDLASRYDDEEGGFGTAPKFPSPHTLLFLLALGEAEKDAGAINMVSHTLEKMRQGGIFDQIGFGFHRYSTDKEWLVPHFEKMLYDQAMLLLAFTEASRITGREDFAQTAREIVEYIDRDMRSSDGAFYSAEDADSEGEEGIFYLWTEGELNDLLAPEDAAIARAVWNTSPTGNFLDEASAKASIDNILHLSDDLGTTAKRMGLFQNNLRARLAHIRMVLLKARSMRPRPLLDDKVLTDWNSLMAAALARAGVVLDEPSYIKQATTAVDLILTRMQNPKGRLLHRWRDGHAEIPAFLDDHVFLTWALLELYDATLEPRFLKEALTLQEQTDALFWDRKQGGYFFSAADNEELLVRSREIYDGAMPSGNSVAAHNLIRLGRLTGRPAFEERAAALMKAFGEGVARGPSGHTHLIDALQRATNPTFEIVICGPPNDPGTGKLLATVRKAAPARSSIVLVEPGAAGKTIRRLAPFTENHLMIEGKPTAYVCRNHQCKMPTTDVEALQRQLKADS